MKTGYWVIRTYKAGGVVEKIKYYVPEEKPTRSERRMKAAIKKQQWNESNARRRLARKIRANFTGRDYIINLTYSDEGLDKLKAGLDPDELYNAAHHQLRLWIKRARNACKAAGVELRYIAVTSDLDAYTGELKRVHHHVIVNAEAVEIVMKRWKLGVVTEKHLYADWRDPVRYDMAGYLLDQARRLDEEKKYIPSRNLIDPKPKDRIAINGAELALPRGAELKYRGPYVPGRPQYLVYIPGKEKKKPPLDSGGCCDALFKKKRSEER